MVGIFGAAGIRMAWTDDDLGYDRRALAETGPSIVLALAKAELHRDCAVNGLPLWMTVIITPPDASLRSRQACFPSLLITDRSLRLIFALYLLSLFIPL